MTKRNIILWLFLSLYSTNVFSQKYFKFDAAVGVNHTTQLQGDYCETKTILGLSKSIEFLVGKSFKKCPFSIETGFRMTSLTNNIKTSDFIVIPSYVSRKGADKVSLQSMTLFQIPLLFKWNLLAYPLKNEKKQLGNEKTKRWNFALSTGIIYADYLDVNYKDLYEQPKPFLYEDRLVMTKYLGEGGYYNTRSIALSFGFDAAYKINEKTDVFMSIENNFGLNPILHADVQIETYYEYQGPSIPLFTGNSNNSSNGTNQMLRLGLKRLF